MKIVILGSGGHARSLAGIISLQHEDVCVEFWDKQTEKKKSNQIITQYYRHRFIVGIGDNAIRKEVFDRNFNLAKYDTIVSPHLINLSNRPVGIGSSLHHNVFINTQAVIGRNCIINTGAIIEHDAFIEDHAHIAPGAVVLGGAVVGEGALIGANAVVLPGCKVPPWQTVRACSYWSEEK